MTELLKTIIVAAFHIVSNSDVSIDYWEILNVGSAADEMHIYTTVTMYKMVRNFQGEWCSSIVQSTLYIKVRKNPSNLHLFFAENYQWFEICTDFSGLFCTIPQKSPKIKTNFVCVQKGAKTSKNNSIEICVQKGAKIFHKKLK